MSFWEVLCRIGSVTGSDREKFLVHVDFPGHHDEVVRPARAVDHPVVQHRLGDKAEVVEELLGIPLGAHHLRHELVEVCSLGELEDLPREVAAEAAASEVGGDEQQNFTEVARPQAFAVVQAAVAGDAAVDLGDQRRRMALFDFPQPRVDDVTAGDVGAKEVKVVLRQCAREMEDGAPIRRGHRTEGDAQTGDFAGQRVVLQRHGRSPGTGRAACAGFLRGAAFHRPVEVVAGGVGVMIAVGWGHVKSLPALTHPRKRRGP
ncbi:MAG: hypothetical protein AAFY88_02760 [Acidobacteriota bacterium]